MPNCYTAARTKLPLFNDIRTPPAPSPAVDWLSQAIALGEALATSAVRGSGGAVTWHKTVGTDRAGRPPDLGPHFYQGLTGVAFFLAALFHRSGVEKFRTLALGAVAKPRRIVSRLLADDVEASRHKVKLGGMVGVGGILYALLRIGRWTTEAELASEALAGTALISPERIAEDRNLDVMFGSAGALLSLLALEKEAPPHASLRSQIAQRALRCGEHLLAQRFFQDGGFRGWPANERAPKAGFAHGAAGISLALARLGKQAGREEILDAARQGFRFERVFYLTGKKNWQCADDDLEAEMLAWCNGAPGIALGRLGFLAHRADDEIAEEVERALESTGSAPEANYDFLCCGNLGRVDILLEGFLSLGRRDWLAQAQSIAERAVLRARAQGGYAGLSAEGWSVAPGLFRGLAGIGYALLRLSAPTSLPCCLTLE